MAFLGRLRKTAGRYFANIAASRLQLDLLTDVNLELLHNERKRNLKNPFNQFGKKVFSQNDEDGLTMEIIRRLGIEPGESFFAEFGMGNGLECNSLLLILLEFKGIWVGNEELVVDVSAGDKVKYLKTWITLENVLALLEKGKSLQNVNSNDKFKIISVDLDGNDFYITREILKQYRPELFIVEYNALFPPPVEFCIKYNPNHTWQNADNYFGCSLSTYNKLFEANGYFLVCCNLLTGANAFFVKTEYRDLFPEIPGSVEDIYVPPFYIAGNLKRYHVNSVKTVNQVLSNSQGAFPPTKSS